MATATQTIELQQRATVDVPNDDLSQTAIVGLQQTWKIPSINKYRVPVTFWSLAVRIGNTEAQTSVTLQRAYRESWRSFGDICSVQNRTL
jgi:hypothetical protein